MAASHDISRWLFRYTISPWLRLYWWTGWIIYGLEMVSGVKGVAGWSGIVEPSMTSVLQREIRQLSYPEESEMGIFFALAIPLDDPKLTKAMSVAFFIEAVYRLVDKDTEVKPETKMRHDQTGESRRKRFAKTTKKPIDRRTVYSMLESKFESIGVPGKPCLLRSICETSRHSLHPHNGLIGDLFRIVFTPSSSVNENLPDEYIAAETGRSTNTSDDCRATYSLCPIGIYDYITVAEYP